MRVSTEYSLGMRVSTKYGLGMRVSTKYGLRMRVSAKYGGEGGDGRKGHENDGGEGETQGLLHGNSPFSGANVRKMSLNSFFAFV
jgi:hypothetical protein